MRNAAAVFALTAALAAPGLAHAAGGAPPKALSDQAELSYVQTGGNTKTQTLAAKNLLKYRFTDRLTGYWSASAVTARDRGTTTAESYATELRLDRGLTERGYVYGLAGWNKNRFAGIDQRYYGGAGAGYRLLAGPAHFLQVEGGLNGTNEEYIDGTDDAFLTGRAFGRYEYAFSERSRFSQSAEYLHNFSDSKRYHVIAETALAAALNAVLSMKASWLVRYAGEPVPAGVKRTDTMLAVALVLNY